jgi:beta-ribofuranosylaminobenzene 5'-phosphate synthase
VPAAAHLSGGWFPGARYVGRVIIRTSAGVPACPDGFTSGDWGLRVTAASRLSFTLIDLNGEGGRRNGMASMSLREPNFQATVSRAPAVSVECEVDVPHYGTELTGYVERLSRAWSADPVRVRVNRPLPQHHGFGSKTTTLLAVGKAYARLVGRPVTSAELARVAGRAGTSGASVNLIDRGGFLVDGGHANPPDFADDPQEYLVPSRFAARAGAPAPPVLVNLPFPPWPILVLVAEGVELSGERELDWFRETLPIPRAEARRTAHHVLLGLAPAVAEADYPAFCAALNELTYDNHYKQEQIAVQPEQVRELFAVAREAEEIDAICISVTGPMCYAFSRSPGAAAGWAAAMRERGLIRDHFWSAAQNHPAVFEGVPA